MAKMMYRVYSIVERAKQDDFWLNIGVAFPHEGGPEAGLNVLGYCTQARFLMNCGLPALMDQASTAERVNAQKLIMEHEMGELFKVIGFTQGQPWEPLGFAQGDRTHTL